jgi:hypothetical protein
VGAAPGRGPGKPLKNVRPPMTTAAPRDKSWPTFSLLALIRTASSSRLARRIKV